MKKLALLILVCLCSMSSIAQTADQLKQLKNMTPEQIAQLKKMQLQSKDGTSGLDLLDLQSDGKTNKVDKLGRRTQKGRKYVNTDSTTRTRFGREPLPDKYEKLLLAPGDSISLTKEEYIKLKMRQEKDSLTVFGRDIFRRENLTFAPSLSIATPPNYILSAGDELLIDIWGAAEASYELLVSPEGNINIPNVGLINVRGLSVAEAERRVRSKLVGAVAGLGDGTVHIKITLGDIRSIKVNIVGEAQMPGTYTLPSLATLFNALYAAGGVSDIGSLRNIKLYRNGKEIATLDVYDYLLKGRNDVDMRLEDDDMIVVAPYENIVNITGKVKRPKLYEMKRSESAADIIEFAGGFAGDAYKQNVSLSRKSGGKQFSMHTVGAPEFSEFLLFDRDSISVGEIVKTYANRVSVEGAVWREGDYELSDKLKSVGDLLRVAEGLSDDAFGGRAQVVRTRPDKTLQIIPVNASRILLGTAPDVALLKDDQLIVTSVNDMREGQTISIKGEVNDPRVMPYAAGMTIEDLIVLSKGLKSSASLSRIEVARRVSNPNSTESSGKRAELFSFTIPADLTLTDQVSNFTLQPYDEVYIRRSPGYSEQQNVWVEGEVTFEGEYTMKTSADKLTDLVAAAAGFTPEAYVNGAYLLRRINEYDLERIKSLRRLMMGSKRNAADTMIVDKVVLGDYFPVGIDLPSAMADPQSSSNLTLREGDRLVVPIFNNTVKINGAVYFPTTTTYQSGISVNEYINRAGGYNNMARRKPFIIYMNGKVSASNSRNKVEPGCEIVVPFKPFVEPMGPMQWVGISTSVVSMAAMIVSLLK